MVLPVIAAGVRIAAGAAGRNATRKAAARGAVGAAGDAEATGGAGIRNAEVRYKKRVEGLTTSAKLYARADERKQAAREGGPESEEAFAGERIGGRRDQVIAARTQQETARAFQRQGLQYEPEEMKQILNEDAPEIPDFPFFIFCLALIKDVLDALDLTGVGAILTTLLSLIVGGILFVWLWRGLSGPRWKKQHAEKMAKRLLAVVGLELVPFLKIIPTNTIWVLMNHYEEKHLAQALNDALSFLPAKLRRRVQ